MVEAVILSVYIEDCQIVNSHTLHAIMIVLSMVILGIETSCDETSAAIITGQDDRVHLLANVISSSVALHGETGGIIPEQAAREQIKYILPVITQALTEAKCTLADIDALAVTYGPGLIGSLLVGVETVKTIGYALQKPIIPVNHMIGHIYANWIDPKETIAFPAIALVVSGGHTDLLLLKNHGDFQLLGGTRDDAAGECFDKCARLLGYAYPGGPHISKLAVHGNEKAFPFPRPMLGEKNYEFSFSGLKTAFLNTTKKHFPLLRTTVQNTTSGWDQIPLTDTLSEKETKVRADLCASLQRAIVDVLILKTIKAANQYQVASIVLSGGVSANQLLRTSIAQEAKERNMRLYIPDPILCTDNAGMIASAAYFNNNIQDWETITADPELYF